MASINSSSARLERAGCSSAVIAPGTWALLALSATLLGSVLWSYWPTLVELFEFWQRNQDYSVGMLVPLVAAYLACRRWKELAADCKGPVWIGLLWIAGSELLRLGGVYYGFGSIERYALILTIPGIVLTLGGWRVLYRLRWLLVFLVLMIPLPARVHEAVALPLQSKATALTVFGLELLGFFVVREGNVLRLDEATTISVTEACSGLRMLTAFILVAAVLALLIKRPAWQKVVLIAGSVPIAILSNALRGIATALFVHYAHNPTLAEKFHDAAGLAMMPLALLMLAGVLKFLNLVGGPDVPRPALAVRDSTSARAAKRPGGARLPMGGKEPIALGRRSERGEGALFKMSLAANSKDAPEMPSLRRGAGWTTATLAVLLLIASGLGYRDVSAAIARDMDVKVKLDPPLSTLPRTLGAWQGDDVGLTESVQKIAGNDDFVNRSYRNIQTREEVMLYVGYTARPRTMLRHRPTVCYPSAGYTHVGTEQIELHNGTDVMPALLHRFFKPGLTESRVVVLNYYVLNGVITINEDSFWGVAWRDPKRARDGERYVAQIQIVAPIAGSDEAAAAAVRRFATDAAPFILSLLPKAGERSTTTLAVPMAQTAGWN